MTGRETTGAFQVPRLGCDAYPDQRDRRIPLLKDRLDILQLRDSRQNFPVFKVRAPFYATRMRDWRGNGQKQVWLWSRRGKGWVIEQELHLGLGATMSSQIHAERRCAHGRRICPLVAPKTCRGTITDRRIRQGNLELLFHPDERFDQRISDLWVLEAEVEMCPRPTDAEVKVVNLLEKRGH